AAISIPNLVRTFLPLILLLFATLRGKNSENYVTAAWITGVIVIVIGFISVLYTKETFGKELDFVEK
ncbi:MAG: MFS transporter, partial [Flavisolibacter sp.]